MSKNYKICIIGSVHWSASMGGIEYQVKLLIDKLKNQKNVTISFITNNSAPGYEPNGYNIVQLKDKKKLNRYATFFGVMELYHLFKKIKPDVIYQNGSSALISAAAVYANRFDCKLIWHVASDSNVVSKIKYSPIRQIHKLIEKKFFEYGIKRAHKVVAQTIYQKKLVKMYNDKAKIHLVRNFHPYPEDKNKVRKKNQIIWVANFKKLKQPEMFIELSKKLNKKQIDVECIMIGKPATASKYQKMLEEAIKATPNLHWMGKQPIEIVNKHIYESKVFVNTSKWEGFPNTYIQAWMRETPVVTLTCDPDNLINNYGLGFLSGTYNRLVRDVITLLQDDQKRISIGEKAMEYSLEHFSLKNLDKLIKIIM